MLDRTYNQLQSRPVGKAPAGAAGLLGSDPRMLQMIQQRLGAGGQAPGMQAPLAYKPFLGQQAPGAGMGRNMAMTPPGAVAPGVPGQMPPQALQGILATLAARRMG